MRARHTVDAFIDLLGFPTGGLRGGGPSLYQAVRHLRRSDGLDLERRICWRVGKCRNDCERRFELCRLGPDGRRQIRILERVLKNWIR